MRRSTWRALAAPILAIMSCLQLAAAAHVDGTDGTHADRGCSAVACAHASPATASVKPAAEPDARDTAVLLAWLTEETLPGFSASAAPAREQAHVLPSLLVCYTAPSLAHPTRPPASA